MALFLTKPILWNREGYRRPSGVAANSGFPHEHGFGHEEWNDAAALSFVEDGVTHRVFHTEGVGHAPVAEEAGRIFVFLYASHDGVQELVGVAGNATCLIDDEAQRRRLVSQLGLQRLGDDAWAVPRVRALHRNDRAAFDKVWQADIAWIPNWRCPADTFLWLAKPAPLDPQALRSTTKLLTMFGRHTEIDQTEALKMLSFVPALERTPAWHRIHAEIEGPDSVTLAEDLSHLGKRAGLATTRKQLIDARLGQGQFRNDVARQWGGACAVSGCTLAAVLRASHIMAWSRSDDVQRLDGANGLLLTAELDALFDRGLIAFADDGGMLLSPQLPSAVRVLFGLPRALRKAPSPAQQRYLADHRTHWAYTG